MRHEIKDNGLVELIPSDGFRLVRMDDRIAAQGSVFLPSMDFAEGWKELPLSDVVELEKRWQEETEKEMEANDE